MKMRTKGCSKLLFLFLVLSFILAGNAFSKDIMFSFTPKDGTTVTQKLSTTREKHLGPAGTQIDESFSITKVTYRKTKEGWDVKAQPISSVMKRNGQEVNNPVVSLLSKLSITYKLDQDGFLKDIIGFETLMETVNSQFSPEVAQKLAPMLNKESLKQKEAAEWNGRIGDYLGKEISVGDTWQYEVPFKLPNGVNLNYKVRTHFKKQIPCGTSKCILIEQVYDSAGEGMGDLMNDAAKSLPEGVEEKEQSVPNVRQSGSSIQGRVTRLIDPTTMNIYEEELERTMQMEMDVPGQGRISTKMIEKRSYEYEYEG